MTENTATRAIKLRRAKLQFGAYGGGAVVDALAALQNLIQYGRWQIGPESASHHPTLPSAVAAAESALDAALEHLVGTSDDNRSAHQTESGTAFPENPPKTQNGPQPGAVK